MKIEFFAKGEVIIKQGDPSNNKLYLVSAMFCLILILVVSPPTLTPQ